MALSPGANVELMRSVLGTPNKIIQDDEPLALNLNSDSEETKKTNSYLYIFKNAFVKITSENKEKIDTLTVLAHDDSIFFEGLAFPWLEDESIGKFWQTTVSEEMINGCQNSFIRTMRDFSFVLSFTVGASIYKTFTYFGHNMDMEENDPKSLIGGLITGVCISEMGESAYYIYDYEII